MNEASDANGYIWGSAVQTQGCTVSLQIVEADSFLAVGVLRCLCVCARAYVCACAFCVHGCLPAALELHHSRKPAGTREVRGIFTKV